MADPALDLDQAKRLMSALYEPGDSFYVLAYHDTDGGRRSFQKRLTHDARWSAGPFITSADEAGMAIATSVGVFEPGEPGRPARRTEDQCVGLAAFAIDIVSGRRWRTRWWKPEIRGDEGHEGSALDTSRR